MYRIFSGVPLLIYNYSGILKIEISLNKLKLSMTKIVKIIYTGKLMCLPKEENYGGRCFIIP